MCEKPHCRVALYLLRFENPCSLCQYSPENAALTKPKRVRFASVRRLIIKLLSYIFDYSKHYRICQHGFLKYGQMGKYAGFLHRRRDGKLKFEKRTFDFYSIISCGKPHLAKSAFCFSHSFRYSGSVSILSKCFF